MEIELSSVIFNSLLLDWTTQHDLPDYDASLLDDLTDKVDRLIASLHPSASALPAKDTSIA